MSGVDEAHSKLNGVGNGHAHAHDEHAAADSTGNMQRPFSVLLSPTQYKAFERAYVRWPWIENVALAPPWSTLALCAGLAIALTRTQLNPGDSAQPNAQRRSLGNPTAYVLQEGRVSDTAQHRHHFAPPDRASTLVASPLTRQGHALLAQPARLGTSRFDRVRRLSRRRH